MLKHNEVYWKKTFRVKTIAKCHHDGKRCETPMTAPMTVIGVSKRFPSWWHFSIVFTENVFFHIHFHAEHMWIVTFCDIPITSPDIAIVFFIILLTFRLESKAGCNQSKVDSLIQNLNNTKLDSIFTGTLFCVTGGNVLRTADHWAKWELAHSSGLGASPAFLLLFLLLLLFIIFILLFYYYYF